MFKQVNVIKCKQKMQIKFFLPSDFMEAMVPIIKVTARVWTRQFFTKLSRNKELYAKPWLNDINTFLADYYQPKRQWSFRKVLQSESARKRYLGIADVIRKRGVVQNFINLKRQRNLSEKLSCPNRKPKSITD